MRGARPLCVDVDCNSQNITAETIRPAITAKTKAIIVVHLAGWPCDMDSILELAEEYGLKVIEDCAQAHGATYKGKPVGSLGHMAAFSFCQDKILTTGGEGGMVTTNDEQLWNRAWSYKDHGKSHDAVFRREHPPGFRWLHESFGTNWRLTEMQSALGRVLLRKLPQWVAIRRNNAAQLTECFRSMPALRVTAPPSEAGHSYYKYYVFVRPERLRQGWNRDPDQCQRSRPRACPVFREAVAKSIWNVPSQKICGHRRGLQVAHELGETSLMFLVHPTLLDVHIERTCETVKRVMELATA